MGRGVKVNQLHLFGCILMRWRGFPALRSRSAAALIFQMARDMRRTVISEFGRLLVARQRFKDRGYAGQSLSPRNGPFSAKRARNLLAEVTFTPFLYYPDICPRSGQLLRDPEFSGPIFIVEDSNAKAVHFDANTLESRLQFLSPLLASRECRRPCSVDMEIIDKSNFTTAPMQSINPARNQFAAVHYAPSFFPHVASRSSQRCFDLRICCRRTADPGCGRECR